jgi:N-acetylneuraminate epimerase
VTGDWRVKPPVATDIGERPDLATLGPAAWQPWAAGGWTARTAADTPVTAASLRGRPHVLLLTLGKACAHCNEQLKVFADRSPAFTSAGLPVVVISTDTPADLSDTDGSLPFPVYSGADTAAFRGLDAWDDFEGKPLHATCFVDADGRMRWQHVGYEPFMLPDFLIQEAARLSACAAIQVVAEKAPQIPVRPALQWRQRIPLPDPVGVAGSFAGVSDTTVLVAGGANFPQRPPWAGGRKVWHDEVWAVAGVAESWKQVGRLPRPLAYGVSATGPRGLICVGGSDEVRHHGDCFFLRLVDGEVQVQPLPSLPQPVANACGAIVGGTLYVCGGTESPEAVRPLAALWALDLAAAPAGWKKLQDCPGGPRMLATAAAAGDGLFVCGGADLKPAADRPERIYRRDAWLYRPGHGWKRLADAPQPIVAAPSPAPVLGSGEVVVLGGDTGEHVGFQPPEKHPGFSRRVLGYDPAHDRWRDLEPAPVARVTVPTVHWQGEWLVPSGEERPGVRSPQVWRVQEVATP